MRHGFQPAVSGGQLQRFQHLDAQRIVQAVRQAAADAGHGAQQRLGIGVTAQALQLAPAADAQHLGDRRRDARAHARQGVEPGRPFLFEDLPHIAQQAGHRGSSVPISPAAR